MNSITVERIGKGEGSSIQFRVTFPDDTWEIIGSPPWSDLSEDDPRHEQGAREFAELLWKQRQEQQDESTFFVPKFYRCRQL